MVLVEMEDMVLDGLDWTDGGVTGEAMANGFPWSGVLLVSIGEGDVGPLLHIIPRTITGGDVLGEWTSESGVIEMEGLAAALISGWREGAFTRVAEEVESKGAQVKNGLGACLIRFRGEAGNQGLEDGSNVDGPDA